MEKERKMPPIEELVRLRVLHSLPGMDAVTVRTGLTYKTTGDGPLAMDVYAPPAPSPARPAVVMVHGGPIPRIGARRMGVFVSYGEILAASGLAVVAFDHRFLAPARLEDAASDVADLLAHVRAHAAGLGVDAERLALWAFSGGGPFLSPWLRERPSWLRAVVASYAILDLIEPPPGADSGIGPDLRRAFSALDALGEDARGLPPLLVLRAGLDHPWLNAGLDRFVQAACARGAAVELLNHPEGRHGFDILDDDPRTRAMVRRTVAFLREQLVE